MARWIKRWLTVALLFGACVGAAAMELDPAVDRVPLWSSLQAVADPRGEYGPEQVAARVAAGQADRLPHANHAFGKGLPYPYWAQLTLSNPDAESRSWVLTHELPTQDEVRLWMQDPQGRWVEHVQLERLRPLAFSSGLLYPAWRLHLQGRQEVHLMLRLDGYNLMRFPLFAIQDDAFVLTQGKLHLGIGMILAVPLVVVLYVLTLIPVAADRSLPLFLAMAACEMLGAMWVSGAMHHLLPWLDRWQTGWLGWAGYVGLLGLSALHARVFLDTRAEDPVADRWLRVGAWLWLMVVPLVACIWPPASRRMLVMGGTLYAFAMMVLALRHAIRRAEMHRLLFLAVWGVYAFSGLLYVLYRLIELPIHITLISNFVQGSLVAALLGCAVSVQILRKRNLLRASVSRAQDRSLLYAAAQHDLLQPLQSVNLYAQALRHAPLREQGRLLHGIDEAMRSVNDFMVSMRQMSTSEQPVLDLKVVGLHTVLEPVVHEFRQWARARGVTLRYLPSERLIRTDVQMMQRIARNLLSNALRYTDEGGRILIGCRRRRGRLWLMVIDNGIGMSEADAARCFEAFQRGGELERVPEGMGLGLYSVKRMASLLGQLSTLTSVSGKGTAVGVSLAAWVA
jgi:signal transduction histidine kinase